MKRLLALIFVLAFARVSFAETFNYYVPYYSSLTGYSTGIAVRNCSGSDAASVTVKVYNTSGSLIKTEPAKVLQANGQTAFYPGTSLNQEGWLLISADQSLAGLAFSFRNSDPKLMFDVPFVSELASDILIPHVGQDSTWDTIIMACNPNNVSTTLTIRFVAADGTKLPSYTRTIPSRGSGKYMLSEFTGGTPYSTGSVEIHSTNNVTAFALFNDLKSGGLNYAGISPDKASSSSSSEENITLSTLVGSYKLKGFTMICNNGSIADDDTYSNFTGTMTILSSGSISQSATIAGLGSIYNLTTISSLYNNNLCVLYKYSCGGYYVVGFEYHDKILTIFTPPGICGSTCAEVQVWQKSTTKDPDELDEGPDLSGKEGFLGRLFDKE